MKRKRRNDRENWLGCRMKNIICLRSFHLIFLISRTFSWSADERHLTQENKTNEDGPTSTLRCMPREKRKITCTNISCLRHWLITSATFWSCCPRSSHRSRRTWPKLWDLRDGRLSVFFKLPHVPPKKRLSRDVEPNKKISHNVGTLRSQLHGPMLNWRKTHLPIPQDLDQRFRKWLSATLAWIVINRLRIDNLKIWNLREALASRIRWLHR